MKKQFTFSLVVLLLFTFNFTQLTVKAQPTEEIQKLLADDGAAGDDFGYSVCISGDYAIVGSRYDSDNGLHSGSAYIFYNNGNGWQQQAKLVASDAYEEDYFGQSVSISGNYAIVGAYGDDDDGSFSGSVYIFYNNAGIWQQQTKLTASDGAAVDYLGYSVSISGDYAVVGAHLDDDNGSSSGSAYIFYNNGGNWQQHIKLTSSDGASDDYFGNSVNISNDNIIIGAKGDWYSGSAYIFNNNAGNWVQQAKIVPSDGTSDMYFGCSVSIVEDYALVGAYRGDGNAGISGSAYIFYNNGGNWLQQAKLFDSEGVAWDNFGGSVSINSDYAIVGSWGDDDNGNDSGSSFIFYNNSGTWEQQAKLTVIDGSANDQFGCSVSISGDYAIVGAKWNDGNVNGSGSAYIFGPPQSQSNSLNLTAFLEGPYSDIEMNTNLNPEPIPLSQPYNNSLKWDYQGTETVASIPNGDIVDWVLVELRETTGDASTALPDSMITQQAAFILNDGTIVGLDGISLLFFDNEITDNLYVVVYHRNHLPVMSSGSLTAAKGEYTWDFTISTGQAYGTDAQTNINGVWGMIGGDANANGVIDTDDKVIVWDTEAGNNGYLSSDLNLDSEANNIDKNDIWTGNNGESSQIPLGFFCGDSFIDDRDGHFYNTVQIGSQCWMAENLNIGTLINGSSNQSNNSTIEKYCYNNNISNCDIYGGLYQWNEMMQYVTTQGTQGICPEGWHLPSDDEYKTLEMHVGMSESQANDYFWRGTNEGSKLAGNEPQWSDGNLDSNEDFGISGFNALPGGGGSPNNLFGGLTNSAFFWTSNENNSSALYRSISSNNTQVLRIDDPQSNGYSIRCLKDEPTINQPPSQPSNPSPQNGSTNISIDTTLSWSCSDPDSDDLTYNIYFGTETNPPLIQVNHVDTFYNPGTLINDTSYYWKIVAYDTPGDSTVGDFWSFSTIEQTNWSCGDPLMDDRDGQSYNTVQIGTQCWMAENLNIGTRIDGVNDQTNNSVIEKYCYNNFEDSCDVYGGLYQWNEMMEYVNTIGTQGICPVGWHLPTNAEVILLFEFLGGTSIAGGAMKEIGLTYWSSPNTGATNSSGFSGYGNGYSYPNGAFSNLKNYGYLWTSNENGNYAWNYYLKYSDAYFRRSSGYSKSYGFAVRCIKDE